MHIIFESVLMLPWCLPWLCYPLINRKRLWHQQPKCRHSCCHAELRKLDLEVMARHLNEVEAVQHVYLLYGSDCLAVSKMDARKLPRSMHSTSGVCVLMLGIKWYQFVRNDDVRRLTKQPKLTAIIHRAGLPYLGVLCAWTTTQMPRGSC